MERFVNVKPIECYSSSETKSSTRSLPSTGTQIDVLNSIPRIRFVSSFAKSAYQLALNDDKSSIELATRLVDVDRLLPPIVQIVNIDTFTGLKFIMADPLCFETREIYDQISGTFLWMYYQQETQCISSIRNEFTNKRVFLITSGSQGRKLVPQIHVLPQVYCIYIHCANLESNMEWARNYSKVRVVCNNDDKYLLPQFALDVAQANIDWGNALIIARRQEEAKRKFNKALSNLVDYIKEPDPFMVKAVEKKLQECQ